MTDEVNPKDDTKRIERDVAAVAVSLPPAKEEKKPPETLEQRLERLTRELSDARSAGVGQDTVISLLSTERDQARRLEAAAEKKADELRRNNGSIARDRDMWKARAEELEAAADPEEHRKMREQVSAAVNRVSALQRKQEEMVRRGEDLRLEVERIQATARQGQRHIETLEATCQQMERARNEAQLQLAVEREKSAGSVELARRYSEEFPILQKRLARLRDALDPADVEKSFWTAKKIAEEVID